MDALIVTSDLQGTSGDQLLGEVLPAYVRLLLEVEWPELGLMGELLIRQALEAGPVTVVFSGHTYWDTSLVELSNGTQIVNADSKLFIWTR